MRKGRKKNNEKLAIYVLLGLIGVLLIALLYVIAEKKADTGITETDHVTDSQGHNGEEATGHVYQDGGTANTGGSSVSHGSSASADNAGKRRLYIVIDDVGNNIRQLKPFLRFKGDITFAVMPQRQYSRAAVSAIKAAGKEYIMHQPMESINENLNPGAGAIFSGMDKNTIYDIMTDNLESVPGARGMNNHMGSRLTSDPDTLCYVYDFIKENDMFFLDSITMPVEKRDVAEDLAKKYSLKYSQRNAMFLDNENDRASILRMFEEGKKVAGKKGHAVMIGHVVSSELADILIEMYPEILDEGYTFHGISELYGDED